MDATTTTTTAVDTMLDTAMKVVEFSGDCLSYLVENPIYAFMFAGVFIGVGVAVIKKFKSAAGAKN